MQSAQTFFESYLREKEALHEEHRRLAEPFNQKYYSEDYLTPLLDLFALRQKHPEEISSTEISDEATRFITTSWFGKIQQRSRYHLCISGERWEIYKKEAECPVCHGKSHDDKNSCRFCGGVGWKDYHFDAT
jgi:hypothetical protein